MLQFPRYTCTLQLSLIYYFFAPVINQKLMASLCISVSAPLQGNIIDLPKDEDTPKKRVDKIFKQMDKVCIKIMEKEFGMLE